jgi:YHS domain-containing protein
LRLAGTNEAVKGTAKYESVYQGTKYYFRSASNKARFTENPAKYVPQYGAFCADGLLEGKLEDIDPTVFLSVEGGCTFVHPGQNGKAFRPRRKKT